MQKKNVLLIPRIGYKTFFIGEQPIIDPQKYNLHIIARNLPNSYYPSDLCSSLHLLSIDDFNNPEVVAKFSRDINSSHPIDYIISVTEQELIPVSKLREEFNVEGMSENLATRFIDKIIMKHHALKGGLLTPSFISVSTIEDLLDFYEKFGKIVIKPTRGAGSRDTFIINNRDELFKVAELIVNREENYMAEEYIKGRMFHCDGVIRNGEVQLCSISEYHTLCIDFLSGVPNVAIMIDESPFRGMIENFHKDVVEVFEVSNGITHLEIFYTDEGKIVFCEIAARAGGGGIVPSIQSAYGVNLFHADVLIQLGEPLPDIRQKHMCGYIDYPAKKGKVVKISKKEEFMDENIVFSSIRIDIGDEREGPSSGALDAFFAVSGSSEEQIKTTLDDLNRKFIYEVR